MSHPGIFTRSGTVRTDGKGSRCRRPNVRESIRNGLDQRRREDPLCFSREYECHFGSPEDSLFTPDMIDRMVVDDFEPLSL
jgi:hypothetical protein